MYNRRQRELFLDKKLETLQNARTAYTNGTATSEQLELLKNEKIEEIYRQKKDEEKEQKPWYKFKRYLFQGLKTDESVAGAGTATTGIGNGNGTGTTEAVAANTENKPSVLEALNASKSQSQAQSDNSGNEPSSPAENVEDAPKQQGRSWKSWLYFWR